jgi:hypothetical protein
MFNHLSVFTPLARSTLAMTPGGEETAAAVPTGPG